MQHCNEPEKEMEEALRIGVYICHCGNNISRIIDIKEVVEFSRSLPFVVVVRDYPYMCSYQGQKIIEDDIKNYCLNRIVVAACSPRIHEQTFRACCENAGLNPFLFEQANIREQCSWVHDDREKATEKAKSIVRGAVARSSLLEPLEENEVPVYKSALVLGGGIAGITASLELAEMGFNVYLVEREPSIGGNMARLDKTFPTLDCSACILTPKMSEIENHKRIKLMTNAEIENVDGYIGNFHVRIRVKSRFISEEKCRGCISECEEHCPVYARSEFESGMKLRKAIYVPFPQAVPLVARIDEEICIGCRLCEMACPFDAVDFFRNDDIVYVNVGAIIVATGFKPYDASKEKKYGYKKFKNVITALEFERLSSASGPTGGKIVINGKEPKDVVFISCVGSRQRDGNKYCSRVCCMFTAKHAFIVKERIPDARVTVVYTDVRAYGDGFEEFYQRVRQQGVLYVRRELDDPIEVIAADAAEEADEADAAKEAEENSPATACDCGNDEDRENDREPVREDGKNEKAAEKLIVRFRSSSGFHEIPADLVVLATGLEPSEDAGRIADMLHIQRSSDGFFMEAHPKLRPVNTLTEGIFIAGCCQSPKDISESVAQASAAASKCAELLSGSIIKSPEIAAVDAHACAGCGICVSVCPFGALRISPAGKAYPVRECTVLVDEITCKGCGSCAAACPAGAITVNNHKNRQILAQIDALC